MPLCELHNVEAIVKPGGVSGPTSRNPGRRYDSFYACPSKNEDGSYCQFRFTQRPPIAGFGQMRAQQSASGADKDKAIRWMNGLKIASELMAAGTIPVGPDWKVSLETAATYVYNLNAPASTTEPF